MTRLVWDTPEYEFGVTRGVFYAENSPGVIWPGLISVEESTEQFEEKRTVIDGITVRRGRKSDSFSANLEVFRYPDAFFNHIAQVRPKPFGMTYRIEKGDGYYIHVVYNVLVNPHAIEYFQDTPSMYKFSISTSPVMLPEGGFSAHMIIDSEIAYPEAVSDLEDLLYGTDTTDPTLPSPIDIFEVFETNSILQVIDNGDGTFTVIGPDDSITMLDVNTFEITWPSATYLTSNKYKIHSL